MLREISEKQQTGLTHNCKSQFSLSRKQVAVLKKAYNNNPLPNHSITLKLAEELNVDWEKVNRYFSNKRHRERKKQFKKRKSNGK